MDCDVSTNRFFNVNIGYFNMKTSTELKERKKRTLNKVVGVIVFSMVLYVGQISAITQIDANNAWINSCNEKYGENNWEIRSGTWEERCNISHHIGSLPIPYIGQVIVCGPKEK